MQKIKNQKGFTLIEILVVIGIIAVLAAIVLIAINPARQFAQARDTQRVSNLEAILNAVGQRIADNQGVFAGTFVVNSITYTCGPLSLSSATGSITTAMASDITTPTGALGCLAPTYIPSLPFDPSFPPGNDTGYDVSQELNGRVHIVAPTLEPTITRSTPLETVR